MARIIFSRRHHPGSVLLRTVLWSPWSHCGVLDGEHVIQATAGRGVARTPLAEFLADASQWAVVNFPIYGEDVIAAAEDQINKPYDMTGVIGLGLHREWGKDDAWFCSELVAHALEQAGLKLFRSDARRITPQHLWMLNYPVVASSQ